MGIRTLTLFRHGAHNFSSAHIFPFAKLMSTKSGNGNANCSDGAKKDGNGKTNPPSGAKKSGNGDANCSNGAKKNGDAPPAKNEEQCDELVTFQELDGGKGLITLNRPKQLNTLNVAMVTSIRAQLQKWMEEKYFIYLKGAGDKAFCAGGDVVAVTKDESGKTAETFFKEEYKMDALISTLSIPFTSLLSGIVMGGGVGISLFGRYRIATETSLFSMPETQIGFFPDVGVSYCLSRMPNKLGVFLALTGYRLKGYDLVHAGIATHYINTKDIKEFEHSLLCDFEKSCCNTPEDIMQEFQTKALEGTKGTPPPFTLKDNLQSINKWFSQPNLEDAIACIKSDKSDLAKSTMESLNKMSPLSLKLTYKQMQMAAEKELFDCFNTDYRIALKMMNCGDFKEGVRALLIDKDKKPKWKHESIAKVEAREVENFFCPLPPECELGLPESLC